MSDHRVEVRIPTYRRPRLLRRCLGSLIAQTHINWHAIVLDDSPDREAQEVVESFKEERVSYRPNPRKLGCSENIDQAFRTALFSDADFCTVLEDDNWLSTNCLHDNVEQLVNSPSHTVLLRNQKVMLDGGPDLPYSSHGTTRGSVFGNSDCELSPISIWAAISCSEGISNGGLFWKSHTAVSLVVGKLVQFSPMQEFCRSLRINEPIRYAAEPLANFSLPADGMSSRESMHNRTFARGRQAILRRLHRRLGSKLVDELFGLGMDRTKLAEAAENLLDAGIFDLRLIRLAGNSPVRILKGLARRLLIKDPLRAYWSSYELDE